MKKIFAFARITPAVHGRASRALRLAVVSALVAPQPGVFGMAVLESGHPSPVAAAPFITSDEANLKSISYSAHAVSVALDKPEVPYRVFTLSRPPRVVLELPKTVHGPKPYEAAVKDDVLKRIRSSQFKTSPEMVTRIVFDLPRMVPFQTAREGEKIVIRFDAGGGNAASASPASVSGEAVATVTSAAEDRPDTPARKKAPKDLLSALPKNPITIDFDDADVRDVIRVLSEMSGINMIYPAELRGFVTVHLDQVPFNEVFSTVLTMQGLVAQQIGNNILRILTPEGLSTDRGRAVTTYKTFILNYAKASELATHMPAVRISPTGRVTVDERNNALIVTDTPEGLAAAERLIAELDRKPAQVLIETKIVQINLDKSLDLGIEWEYANRNFLPSANSGSRRNVGTFINEAGTSVPEGAATGFVGVRPNPLTGELEEAVSAAAVPGSRGTGVSLPGPTSSAGISFGFINNSEILTASLGALETENQAKTLTNPKIITTNNQQARIQIGSQVPFLQTTVSPGGASTQSTTFIPVGFIIEVTPTINEDNRIRLKVHPESSELASGATSSAGPTINTTTADTEVILRDGDTIVIGGLVSEKMIESASKVPLLGDLPVLGVFFRSTSDKKTRQELLVFITARIVPD